MSHTRRSRRRVNWGPLAHPRELKSKVSRWPALAFDGADRRAPRKLRAGLCGWSLRCRRRRHSLIDSNAFQAATTVHCSVDCCPIAVYIAYYVCFARPLLPALPYRAARNYRTVLLLQLHQSPWSIVLDRGCARTDVSISNIARYCTTLYCKSESQVLTLVSLAVDGGAINLG
jgi:hypothetical protein